MVEIKNMPFTINVGRGEKLTLNKKRPIPPKIVAAVFERDNYTCQYCGQMQPPEQHSLHSHHIIHKSQGGKDVEENLNACCWKCHAKHGEITKTDKRWLAGEDVYTGGRLHKV